MSSSMGMKVALGAAMITSSVTLLYIILSGRKRRPDPGKASDLSVTKNKKSIKREESEMNGHACSVEDSKILSLESNDRNQNNSSSIITGPEKKPLPSENKVEKEFEEQNCEINYSNISTRFESMPLSEKKAEDKYNCEFGEQNSEINANSTIPSTEVIPNSVNKAEKEEDCEIEELVVANDFKSLENPPVSNISHQEESIGSIQEDKIYTVAVIRNECLVEQSCNNSVHNVEIISKNDTIDACMDALSLVNNEIKDIKENFSDSNDEFPVESISREGEVEKCVEALSLVEEMASNSAIENAQNPLAVEENVDNNCNKMVSEISADSDNSLDKIMTKLADVEETISETADDAKVIIESVEIRTNTDCEIADVEETASETAADAKVITESTEIRDITDGDVKESMNKLLCDNSCALSGSTAEEKEVVMSDNMSPLSAIPVEMKEEVINEVMSTSWASVVEEELQEEETLNSVSCNGSEENLGNETNDSPRKYSRSPTSNSSHNSSPRRRKQRFKKTRTDSATADLELETNSEQDQPNSDSVSLISMDSGQGASEIEPETMFNPSAFPVSKQEQYIFYEFQIPQTLVGRLIGRKGAFVNKIKACTEATIIVCAHRNRRYKICSVEGSRHQVDAALKMIREQFPVNKYPDVTLEQIGPKSQNFNTTQNNMQQQQQQQQQPILNSPAMQVTLTAGVVVEVQVSAVVSGGEMWVQQPLHPSFSSLHRLNTCMNLNYTDGTTTPEIPQPIQNGTVCICQVEGQWLRCQVLGNGENDGEIYVLLLDIGGVISTSASNLRQIRFDYLTLPFQASQCLLSGIEPIDGEYWSDIATTVLEELVSGTLLFATVVSYTQEGVPLVNLYRKDNDQYVSLNEKMVQLSHARWLVPAAETS